MRLRAARNDKELGLAREYERAAERLRRARRERDELFVQLRAAGLILDDGDDDDEPIGGKGDAAS